MRRWLRGIFVLLIVILAVNVVSRTVWHRRVDQLRRDLDAPNHAAGAADESDALPQPVARYLTFALPADQRTIVAAELDTSGQFLVRDGAWVPFHARQRFNTGRPGFVWDARMEIVPYVPVFVRDAYIAGHAEMIARVLAVYPVVNVADTDALAEGELMRYVAEMIWFPTALRPGGGVTWTARDDHSAIAHFTDRGHDVSLTFTFNSLNDVIEISSPSRMRATAGGDVPTPWAVTCSAHERRLGVRIPVTCEAEWRPATGPQPYWRGRVDSIRFEY